jgi:hypothetical protein
MLVERDAQLAAGHAIGGGAASRCAASGEGHETFGSELSSSTICAVRYATCAAATRSAGASVCTAPTDTPLPHDLLNNGYDASSLRI